MAEVIGTVSASLEIGNVILEVKQLWSSIKHAPEELSELMDEVNLIAEILQTFGEQEPVLAAYGPPIVVQKCRQACDKAVKALQEFCTELNTSVKRSTLRGSIRTVAQRSILQKGRQRLERAKH